ncbi:MAG: Gfo/Idh/MocA family protein [Planctomycetales bacterium]
MPDTIQVALITNAGGAHVDAYLQALAACEECRQVTLADPDGRWEAAARRVLGSKLKRVVRDYQALLSEERPGMALVSLEARLAPPVIDAVLEGGIHVLAEKPACVRVENFVPLVQKADAKHCFLMLALANRSNPEIIAAREVLTAGRIGRLYALEMHLVADQTRLANKQYQQQWFAQRDRAGGGHLIWLGIHWLDLAMHITGLSISEVAGFTANVGGQPIDVEDAAAAAFRFENGALGTISSGYYLDKGYHSHLRAWGSTGWLSLDPVNEKRLRWYSTSGPQAGKLHESEPTTDSGGYTPFVKAAVRACLLGRDPPVSNADSLRALRTVFAIYQAAMSGQVQALGP